MNVPHQFRGMVIDFFTEDEDFVAESESDVAEEFNEDYQSDSENGGSDNEGRSDAGTIFSFGSVK